jgi:hypothetical protein
MLQSGGRRHLDQAEQVAVKGAGSALGVGWAGNRNMLKASVHSDFLTTNCSRVYFQLKVRTALGGLAASTRARPSASRRTRTTETSHA